MMRTIILLSALVLLTGCGLPAPTDAPPAEPPPEPRRIVATPGAPAAIGPYSQAVRVGERLYLSGQIAIDPANGEMVREGIEAETRQVLANIRAVLAAEGFTPADVVQAQVFLADLDDYKAMNAVYAETFGEAPPARAAVQVARLPLDARVEIMVTAVKSAGPGE